MALVLAGTAYAFVTARSRPVLWSFTEAGDPLEEPVVLILNPFRERAPERVAEAVLDDLKAKRVAEALSPVAADPRMKNYWAGQEARHPLRDWCLENRTQSGATTTLFYLTVRGESKRCTSPLWVDVERAGDSWKIVRFEPWY